MAVAIEAVEHLLTRHIMDLYSLDGLGTHLQIVGSGVRIDTHLYLVVLVDGNGCDREGDGYHHRIVVRIVGVAMEFGGMGFAKVHAVVVEITLKSPLAAQDVLDVKIGTRT